MLVLGLISIISAVALPRIHLSPILITRVVSVIMLYTCALSFNVLDIQLLGSGIGIFSGLFEVSSTSMSVDTFMCLIASIILLPWMSIKSAKFPLSVTSSTASTDEAKFISALPPVSEYSLIILFSIIGASLLISSRDLVSLYLAIELQSFGVYILAALYRNSESATAAGLKYFLLGGLSSAIILLGAAIVYNYTGTTNIEGIVSLLSTGNDSVNINTRLSPTIGMIILLTGLLFKVSRAPFHHWAPDVYDSVPTIVTTWLTIMPKLSIFILLLELSNIGLNTSLSIVVDGLTIDVWKNVLLISSLLSLLIGTIVGLAQTRIKRLLAYSTISHVGFMLLALAINSEESIESYLFYLGQYTLTNLNAFLIILAFGYLLRTSSSGQRNVSNDVTFLTDLTGQFRTNPLLRLSLTLSLFSMAGVPPMIGFFRKQMVLYSATLRGLYFMSFVAIVVSVISASYYLKVIRMIHFEAKQDDSLRKIDHMGQVGRENSPTTDPVITDMHAFIIATLTMVIALFMLKPNLLLNSSSLLALTLFHY